MDLRKLKVNALFSICLISITTAFAQHPIEVPIYVTTSQEPADKSIIAIAADPVVDYVYRKVDTAYRWGYSGFNNLVVGNQIYPLHLEEYDDFNIAVFQQDSTTTIVYSGAQGAVKNDFLLQRRKAFKEYSNLPGLLQRPIEDLTVSLDSLSSTWITELNSYPFSARFKEDENQYYSSYSNYVLLTHQVLKEKKSDLTELELVDFPKIDFNNHRYYTTIPFYREMARAYHFKRLVNLDSKGKGRRYLRDLNGYAMINDLQTKAFVQSTEHHPKAEYLFDVAKPQYTPHDREDRRLHRRSRKTGVGTEFMNPPSFALDGKAVSFDQLKGKKVYLFVYSLKDPNFIQNLNRWNQFHANKKQEDVYFVTYSLDNELNKELWRSLQLNSQIAGWNLGSNLKKSNEWCKDLGIVVLPRVISIDDTGIVIDPNVDLGFQKSKY
ncbi:hypothetical protein [Nonlabens marinus]|uniref:Thioredoxin domain-containing protein n=1 Tax=Nonlabens marinus S1-08 TaxID=1454201 RepID=W8VRJ2_9FLAO|nr:hypothetical protein [Nonlabens marinus]BAO56294.1 hypothetical protein NMS_2285 [Nonlabens marinus S1-08]